MAALMNHLLHLILKAEMLWIDKKNVDEHYSIFTSSTNILSKLSLIARIASKIA